LTGFWTNNQANSKLHPSVLQSLCARHSASSFASIAITAIHRTEDAMLKTISICAALVIFGTAAANAQQQEAMLQNVELPGTGLDIVLAMPKSPGATINLAKSPDALVINLIGGELALAFNNENEMLQALESPRRPACAFQTEANDGTSKKPVSVYVVPNHKTPKGTRTASLVTPQPEPTMRKANVPGSDFAIIFSMTKTPVVEDSNARAESLPVYSVGSELAMAVDGDVKRMFMDVGLSQLPVCAFDVEHKSNNSPSGASVYIVPKY
jgi:hypothetical protein